MANPAWPVQKRTVLPPADREEMASSARSSDPITGKLQGSIETGRNAIDWTEQRSSFRWRSVKERRQRAAWIEGPGRRRRSKDNPA